MTQELPALAKLSLHEEPEPEKMTAQDETSAVNVEEEAKPAVWRPRWRGNPDAKPTPYKPKGSRESFAEPGKYGAPMIAQKLNGQYNHSFMIEKKSLHGIQNGLTEEGLVDAACLPPKIVAILYYRGSNPVISDTAESAREIWTRNNHASVQASIGRSFPFYTYSTSKLSEEAWKRKGSMFFVYDGIYEIESATLVKGKSPEVLAFLKSREESQRERAPEIWQDKFHSDWLKARVVKCKPELQKPDPMLSPEAVSSSNA